eukprot:CAMPEP_0170331984 /NCGR_PEP_ID=MMETSP0116_2-20130129/66980_1 /TAXON_ID=400756 /ORGANISM="Durinskia baltica, Strain CSIRO CS-38" /LENGTH=140 /DNA_ID=CAMNT_0010585263 /DNA_START=269 /DNA_END=687 /DNA_ORIENTATION=-
MPVTMVPMPQATRTVASASSKDAGSGSDFTLMNTFVAICDKKMRPTSCTWPIENGKGEHMVKTNWNTALDKKNSFVKLGISGSKARSRKTMAAHETSVGTQTTKLIPPKTAACNLAAVLLRNGGPGGPAVASEATKEEFA